MKLIHTSSGWDASISDFSQNTNKSTSSHYSWSLVFQVHLVLPFNLHKLAHGYRNTNSQRSLQDRMCMCVFLPPQLTHEHVSHVPLKWEYKHRLAQKKVEEVSFFHFTFVLVSITNCLFNYEQLCYLRLHDKEFTLAHFVVSFACASDATCCGFYSSSYFSCCCCKKYIIVKI